MTFKHFFFYSLIKLLSLGRLMIWRSISLMNYFLCLWKFSEHVWDPLSDAMELKNLQVVGVVVWFTIVVLVGIMSTLYMRQRQWRTNYLPQECLQSQYEVAAMIFKVLPIGFCVHFDKTIRFHSLLKCSQSLYNQHIYGCPYFISRQ